MAEPKRRLRGALTRAANGYWAAHSDEIGDFSIQIGEVEHSMLPHMLVGALVEFDFQKDSDGDVWITDVEVVGVEMPKRKARKRAHRVHGNGRST